MRLSTATVETSVTEMQSPILWTERQEAKFRLVHLKRRTESRTESKRKSLTDIIITPARGPLLEAKIDHRQVTGGGGWFAFFENHMHLTGWRSSLSPGDSSPGFTHPKVEEGAGEQGDAPSEKTFEAKLSPQKRDRKDKRSNAAVWLHVWLSTGNLR